MLNAADFGDLLLETIRLFREHAAVLRQYQERFRYILVDEYQDTNVAQYLWLRLIAQSAARAANALQPALLGSESETEPAQTRILKTLLRRHDDQSRYGGARRGRQILRFEHAFLRK